MSNFKVNIAEIRKSKELKQAYIAEKLNITQQRVSEYERGIVVPSLERLVEIAQILDVSLDELVEFKRVQDNYVEGLIKLKDDGDK